MASTDTALLLAPLSYLLLSSCTSPTTTGTPTGDQPATTPSEAAAATDQQQTAAAAAGRRVKITTDQGMSVSMRGEDPLSLPDVPEVATMRGAQGGQGFVDSETALAPGEGLQVPPEATGGEGSSKPRVKITVDQGMSVCMRGEDPLSLPGPPEVAALRGAQGGQGFVDSETALAPDEGLLVPPEATTAAGDSSSSSSSSKPRVKVSTDQGMSVSMRGEDPNSLPGRPEVAAVRGAESAAGFVDSEKVLQPDEGLPMPAELAESAGPAAAAGSSTADVQTPAGAKHEAEGFGSHEVLLAPAEQAQAAGLTAQAEGLDEPTATMSLNEERLAVAVAAAAAAAATVRQAGGAAAAEVEEAAEAVDARNALLQGPGAEPVQQIMAEAQGIADAAKSGSEALQQQQQQSEAPQGSEEQQQQQQQQPGDARGGRSSKRGGWLKRWITGK
jgi:hypothetical protein